MLRLDMSPDDLPSPDGKGIRRAGEKDPPVPCRRCGAEAPARPGYCSDCVSAIAAEAKQAALRAAAEAAEAAAWPAFAGDALAGEGEYGDDLSVAGLLATCRAMADGAEATAHRSPAGRVIILAAGRIVWRSRKEHQ